VPATDWRSKRALSENLSRKPASDRLRSDEPHTRHVPGSATPPLLVLECLIWVLGRRDTLISPGSTTAVDIARAITSRGHMIRCCRGCGLNRRQDARGTDAYNQGKFDVDPHAWTTPKRSCDYGGKRVRMSNQNADEPAINEDPAAASFTAFTAWRRQCWQRYVTVVVCVAAIFLGGFCLLWFSSEGAGVFHETAKIEARELSTTKWPDAWSVAWTSHEHLVGGRGFYRDVVVSHTDHAVTGRDIRTGAVRWAYSRRDASVCAAAMADAVVVVVYSQNDRCDQVTGLETGTGARRFVRTTALRATTASFRLVVSGQSVALIAPNAIELIAPNDSANPGVSFWLDKEPNGCTFGDVAAASGELMYVSRCAGSDALSVRRDGDAEARAWTVPLGRRAALGIDGEVAVLADDGRHVEFLNHGDGSVVARTELPTAVEKPSSPFNSQLSRMRFYQTGNGNLAFDGHKYSWTARGMLVTSADDRLLESGADRVQNVDPETGAVIGDAPAPGIRATTMVAQTGGYLIAASGSGTVVYRVKPSASPRLSRPDPSTRRDVDE
jgi:hypothetical protein